MFLACFMDVHLDYIYMGVFVLLFCIFIWYKCYFDDYCSFCVKAVN